MTQKILVSLFDNPKAAFDAVQELANHGYGTDMTSLIANETVLDRNRDVDMDEGVSGRGQSMSLPAIGPVHITGPMSSSLGISSADLPLISTLTDEGVPMEDANAFAEGVRRGGTLVMVTSAEMLVDPAKEILSRHNPVDIHQAAQRWRQGGWSRFDDTARPLRYDELDWPESIVRRAGEKHENEPEENWPQDIAARKGEKFEHEEETSNWPENIVDPDQKTDNEDTGTDWPRDITARSDDE
jgi:hypothetical protein